MAEGSIRKIFFPESVVVCGVSKGARNMGREIIMNLDRFDFKGRVYGVGRKGGEIGGRKVYVDVQDLPEVPDLAVLLVPARNIPAFLDGCGAKGVRQAVIETAGFSEFGPERKGLEDEIRRIAEKWGMKCMGPNCIGVINTENGLCLPFVPFGKEEIEKGANALVSQSGGLIHELMRRCSAENVGLGKLASIGNKMMVDGNDILEFLLEDEGTCAVGIYLEDVRNGRRLMDLACGAGKPVIAIKANTSSASRQVASFHTAALLGDDQVVSAAFRQAGIHRVSSLDEMVDCFKIFSLPPMRGPNVVALSRSGGQAVMMADDADRCGFTLPALPDGFLGSIDKQARAGVIKGTNPIDLGDVFSDLFYVELVEKALGEANVDGVVFFYDYPFDEKVVFDVLKGFQRVCREADKPAVLCMTPDKTDWFDLKYSVQFPWFLTPGRAFAALSRSLVQHRKNAARCRTSFASVEDALIRRPRGPARTEGVARTLALVEACGLPVVRYELAAGRAAALDAARRIGYPVALKAAEPLVLHKTEAGAVRLAIGSDEELGEAIDAMPADVYLVQAMAPSGIEIIIGAKHDPEFGPVILFGLGGVFVEVMGDVTSRVLPIGEEAARQMIGEIKGGRLLAGFRGAPPSDTEALAGALTAVSRLMIDHPEIESLDVNPVRVFQEGRGCLALDVKMEVRGDK
jgi:acetyltransferase